MKSLRIWTQGELEIDAKKSISSFRDSRLADSSEWADEYRQARAKFEQVFNLLGDMGPDSDLFELAPQVLASDELKSALRYLSGPPISDDDLKVIAGVASLSPQALTRDKAAAMSVFHAIHRVIDPYRFPWIKEKRQPTSGERDAALMASAVLMAAQRVATERRSDGKSQQENAVKSYLKSLGLEEVRTRTIPTIEDAPAPGQFCGECKLSDRKADLVARLFNKRVLAVECKVSNSAVNSLKRVNNDAVAKANHWKRDLGASQVFPCAVLSGVFHVPNLMQAQNSGLALVWAHDLQTLGDFINSTR